MTPTQVDIGRNQHGNGRPAWLAPAPAASLRRVDHHRGKTTPVNWAGRSEAEQFALVKKYYVRSSWGEFKYDGSWWRKKPGSRVVVAKPTTSPHEPGNAVDTDEWTVPGFVELMAEHGWIRTLKSEPWHFVYFAHLDQHRNDPVPPSGATTGGALAPAPIEIPEGYDMNDVKQIHCTADDKPTGRVHQRALLVPGTPWVLPFTESGATFANTAADQFETGNSRWYTKSMFNAFIAASARCAPTSINVEIADAES